MLYLFYASAIAVGVAILLPVVLRIVAPHLARRP